MLMMLMRAAFDFSAMLMLMPARALRSRPDMS